jgi:polysaccharide pyruvyl transferase WcaK-like protein
MRALLRAGRDLREWVDVLRLARRLDVLIMTGTGMLTDSSEGPLGLPYDMFKWSVAAKICRTRVRFASVGVESIRHPLAKLFIGAALRLADYRSYRDDQSRECLQRIGLAVDGDEVYPDLAFSLPDGMAHAQRAAGERPAIAVGLYDYRGRGAAGGGDAAAYREYVEKMSAFIMWLLSRDVAVRVVIGDLTYDQPVLEDVKASLQTRGVARYGARLQDAPALSVEQVMHQLSGADAVVASRFHNVLFALLLGKPVVSISYNEKNDALMNEMGLARYCQRIDDLDLDRLIDQFEDLQQNAARLRPAIAAKAAAYREQLEEQYAVMFSVSARGKQREGRVSARPRPWAR